MAKKLSPKKPAKKKTPKKSTKSKSKPRTKAKKKTTKKKQSIKKSTAGNRIDQKKDLDSMRRQVQKLEREISPVTGRPKKNIDFGILDRMLEQFNTKDDICYVLGIHQDTLSEKIREATEVKNAKKEIVKKGLTFSEYAETKRAMGKVSLRRLQWLSARRGSDYMLKILGENELDQRSRNDNSHRFPEAEDSGVMDDLRKAIEINAAVRQREQAVQTKGSTGGTDAETD